MSDGVISGNKATYGGGVRCSGIFLMSGGIISGNIANIGGGVYINRSNASFTKSGGGVIYGNDAVLEDDRNIATLTGFLDPDVYYGSAVYYQPNEYGDKYYCEFTLGEDVNITTSTLPTYYGQNNAVGNWIKKY